MKKRAVLTGLAALGTVAAVKNAFAQVAPHPVPKPPGSLPLPGPVIVPEGVMRLQEDIGNIFANLIGYENILADEGDLRAADLAWGVYDQGQAFVNDTAMMDSLTSTFGIMQFSQAMDRGIDNLQHFFMYNPYQGDPTGIYMAMKEKLIRIAAEWNEAKHQELPSLYIAAQRREGDQRDLEKLFDFLNRQRSQPAPPPDLHA